MTQTTFYKFKPQEDEKRLVDNTPDGVVKCLACGHLVPRALICLWCGAKLEGEA